MAKLTGRAKQEFLDRMAKGRAKASRGSSKPKGGSRSSGGAMVPYTAVPMAMMGASSSSSNSPARRTVKQRLTNVLELAAKKQSLFTSLGAGAALGYADHEGWLQELPALDEGSGIDNKFTLAAGLYFLADSDILASMPRLRLFAMDTANVSAGIGAYNATRVYLSNREKKAPANGEPNVGYRHREEF